MNTLRKDFREGDHYSLWPHLTRSHIYIFIRESLVLWRDPFYSVICNCASMSWKHILVSINVYMGVYLDILAISFLLSLPNSKQLRALFLVMKGQSWDPMCRPLWNSFMFFLSPVWVSALTSPSFSLRTPKCRYAPKSIASQRLFCVGPALGKQTLNKMK